ncbi:unnamed protein product [marine sediment metagenome]|uniref:PilN domain-containing protein n=1 Tax=marine sediment metagenome TaxID=412755 RepID=X1Q0Z4_9ZZZZ
MVQELIPKEKLKTPSLINSLFYSSLALLIILGGVYLGMRIKVSSLKSQIEETKVNVVRIKTEGDKETERQVLGYQKKIKDFSELFSEHKIVSSFLEFLRNSTHLKVSFSDLSLNTKTANVLLGGETEDFKTLGEQILYLKGSEFIKGLDLSNLSLGKEGEVQFNIRLFLDPKIFKNE